MPENYSSLIIVLIISRSMNIVVIIFMIKHSGTRQVMVPKCGGRRRGGRLLEGSRQGLLEGGKAGNAQETAREGMVEDMDEDDDGDDQ
jgi:hypothetical protein